MDLRGQEIKNTYGNVVTVGSSAGAPTTGELTNGQNTSFTSTYLGGNFGIGSAPTTYGSLNVLGIGSAASAGGAIIDIVGTSGRLASIYTEASGKLVLTADPTNAQAGTSMEFNVDGSNAMFIDSSLRVGIGTTSGTSKANILSSTVAQTVLTLEGNSASSGSVELLEFSRSGGAVSGAIQYQDADTAMSIGTTSYHAFLFNTANSERMRITNAGNVGIGTTSPAGRLSVEATGNHLTVRASTAAAGKYWALDVTAANQLYIINNAGTQYLTITDAGNVGIGTSAPNTQLEVSIAASVGGVLRLNNARTALFDGDVNGIIQFSNNEATAGASGVRSEITSLLRDVSGKTDVVFTTAGSGVAATEKLRILADGGITFNGDTLQVNALDDYEEGTFTANLLGSTTNPTTPASVTAYYTKIGRQATVNIRFNNVDLTGCTGDLYIAGLPFTSASGMVTFTGALSTFNIDFDGGTTAELHLPSGDTNAYLYSSLTNAGWRGMNSSSSNAYLQGTITYFV